MPFYFIYLFPIEKKIIKTVSICDLHSNEQIIDLRKECSPLAQDIGLWLICPYQLKYAINFEAKKGLQPINHHFCPVIVPRREFVKYLPKIGTKVIFGKTLHKHIHAKLPFNLLQAVNSSIMWSFAKRRIFRCKNIAWSTANY